jgi:hypothetical protein
VRGRSGQQVCGHALILRLDTRTGKWQH